MFIIDTETNALKDYTKLHCIVLRNVKEPSDVRVYRNIVHPYPVGLRDLLVSSHLVGHNIVGFDLGVLHHFLGVSKPVEEVTDTLVLSRLIDRLRDSHSLESYGEQFKAPKNNFNDFSEWSQELENRCIQDTYINWKVYDYYKKYLNSPRWEDPIRLEHLTAALCNTLGTNGFLLDVPKGKKFFNILFNTVEDLKVSFKDVFPKRSKYIKTITPVLTSKGTLNSKDFRWTDDLTPFTANEPFSLFEWEEFNPNSAIQRVKRLNEAGWKPFNKTKGHIIAERNKDETPLQKFREIGWTTDEENLATLPEDAPEAARKLKEYLLLASRLGDLEEWLGLVRETGRIHGQFTHLGAWSGRVTHQKPNMANIPSTHDKKGRIAPWGREFREIWIARPGYKLVGVDAEGIQLRVFAHLCNDRRLIKAIEEGKKEEKTDIHHLNKAILDTICNSRDTAKTYIYALLLGAGTKKQAEILGCSTKAAKEGYERILTYYPGWRELEEGRLQEEGERLYIEALDGRYIRLPEPRKALAAHLQGGETILMARAATIWQRRLQGVDYLPVNWVHDEWQTEVRDLPGLPELVAKEQMLAIEEAGRHYNLNIRLAGSAKIGNNWAETH